MDHRLWSKLPAELLELVLTFLPVVNLCRFRVVCRRWNTLLWSSQFGKLCAVNTVRIANERACLVVYQQGYHLSSSTELSIRWIVLDLRERKWHNLQPGLPGCRLLSDMDGGFICTSVHSYPLSFKRSRKPVSLIVFNPFGKTVKVLPDLPSFDGDDLERYSFTDASLKLIVDNTSNTFKVFFMIDGQGCRFLFRIYQSSTNQWTTAPMPPPVHVGDGPLSRVVFQGRLYCCAAHCHDHDAMLWSFDFLDGSWEDAGVQFPNVGSTRRDLAVIDNRLFMMKIVQEKGTSELLDISEILLADKIARTITRKNFSAVFPRGTEDVFRPRLRAFGFNESELLLCAGTGVVVMYNLATGEWECLTPDLLDSFRVDMALAGRMDYFLPNTW